VPGRPSLAGHDRAEDLVRRDLPEMKIGRELACCLEVWMRVIVGVSSELVLDEAAKHPLCGGMSSAERGRLDGVIDRQGGERIRIPLEQRARRRRPARRDVGGEATSLQAFYRVRVGDLRHMLPQHPLHECAVSARGRKRPAVRLHGDEAVRIDSLHAHRNLSRRRSVHPGDEERGIPVRDDRARACAERRDQPTPGTW
jgi:hypothetical protein